MRSFLLLVATAPAWFASETESLMLPPSTSVHRRSLPFTRAQSATPTFGYPKLQSSDARQTGSISTIPRTKTTHLLSTTESTTDSVDGATGDGDARTRAVRALEILSERQRADLQDTERLLATLANVDGSSDQQPQTERSWSAATSVLSGFDYGFISRSEGAVSALKAGSENAFERYGKSSYGGPPSNILVLGVQQFVRNLNAIQGEYKDEPDVKLSPKQAELQTKLEGLTLNSTAIWERELADGPIEAPLLIKIPYLLVCYLLDVVFEGRYVPSRFFLLETVARVPYFSYISMLHLYETLGFWRRSADVKRVHFSEEINEYHHLLIMESLGGDQSWWVRFVAQHSAIVYIGVLCLLWALSPTLSYRFSELLETHAVNTYGVFLDENEKLLKELPPSVPAIEYYSFASSDPFYAEIQTSAHVNGEVRRPGERMHSLYDVFCAIRADEGDHVGAMQSCLDREASLRSPSIERRLLTGLSFAAMAGVLLSTGGDIGGLTDLVDGTGGTSDVLEDAASAVGDGFTLTDMLEAAAAGLAGLAQTAAQEEEEIGALGAGKELLEVVVGAGRVALVALGDVAKFFLPFL